MKANIVLAACCLAASCGWAGYIHDEDLHNYDWSTYKIATKPGTLGGAHEGIILTWGARVRSQASTTVQGIENGTYVIFRDGEKIATIVNTEESHTASYVDLDVSVGETYAYHVVGTAYGHSSTSPTNFNCTCYYNYVIGAPAEVAVDGAGGAQSLVVEVSYASYERKNVGGSWEYVLDVQSTSTWSGYSTASWLSCSKSEDGSALQIVAGPNGTGDVRSADIVIFAGAQNYYEGLKTKKVRVEQVCFNGAVISTPDAGMVAVPADWAEKYDGFAEKFGGDFANALMQPTGKCDGAGNPMLVWQDYVAGTDPTDENDVFAASIAFDADGKPIIGHSPEFADAAEVSKRKYTTYGKVKLNDADWVEVPDSEEANYNFFKVTVEMK